MPTIHTLCMYLVSLLKWSLIVQYTLQIRQLGHISSCPCGGRSCSPHLNDTTRDCIIIGLSLLNGTCSGVSYFLPIRVATPTNVTHIKYIVVRLGRPISNVHYVPELCPFSSSSFGGSVEDRIILTCVCIVC